MDSNYYTPDISEFHVGFEYEEREFIYTDKGWYTSKVNGFVPKVFQGDSYLESYYLTERVKRKLYNDSIRVKYLDKEDIESLGFKGHSADAFYFETKGDWILDYYPEEDYHLKVYKEVDCDYGCDPYEYYFQGQCKNKSELKRLFKQLGINE